MSFMVSSLTGGLPPLLADFWAIKTMVKMHVDKKISGTKNHKSIRDDCVDSFAEILGLKARSKRLRKEEYIHKKDHMFECGSPVTISRHDTNSSFTNERQRLLEEQIKIWKAEGFKAMQKDLNRMMGKTALLAHQQGFLAKPESRKQRSGQENASHGHR